MSQNNFSDVTSTVVNWMADYQARIRSFPVLSKVRPGEILEKLPTSPNLSPDCFDDMFSDFKDLILPGITHWQHPNFFAYFPANSSPPSIIAEMLIDTLGVQGMSWATSPAATELEIRMMKWLQEMFGLSPEFSGVIQDSASNSTMSAMIVAREKATDFSTNETGVTEQKLVAYCSSEAHSSVEKAAKMIGIGRQNLRKIAVNANQEMRVDLLIQAIEDDLKNGKRPFFMVGAFGTTGSTAVDDLKSISNVAKKYGIWFHVDAAYAGSALVLPEVRMLADGINQADSVVINPHKWLLTTFDCSAFFIKDRTALLKSFSILPEYLKTPEAESVTNFRDWGPGLGRRFRSLKLWFVIRWYGVTGIQNIIRNHISLSAELESWIRNDPRFEVMTKRQFNLVCFRLKSGDGASQKLLSILNQSGDMFLSHTRINGSFVLRLVIGQTDVTAEDVRQAWDKIKQAASLACDVKSLAAD
jgi:aromatic-L-amino-acid decarboxylase